MTAPADPRLMFVSSILGGITGSSGSRAQARAIQAQVAEGARQFNLQWDAGEPYREAAVGALTNLAILTGQDPMFILGQQDSMADDTDIQGVLDSFTNYANSFRGDNARNIRTVVNELAPEGSAMTGVRRNRRVDLSQLDAETLQNIMNDPRLDYLPNIHGYQRELENVMTAREGRLAESAEGLPTAAELVMSDPSYEFRRKEGEDAVKNMLSATGLRISGDALKQISNYNQNFATTEYDNVFRRNMQVAGMSDSGPTVPNNQALNYGLNNAVNAAGGRQSSWNNAIQGGIQNYLTYSTANRAIDAYQNRPQQNYFQSPSPSGYAPIPGKNYNLV